MSSWRFSRFSARSRTSTASLPPSNEEDGVLPPRYSNLASPGTQTTQSSVSVAEVPMDSDDTRSIASMGSNITSPTYYTQDDARSIAPSTMTLTNPPRYSRLANAGAADANSPNHDLEYTFPIRGGFKSEPWATLRLYDAETPAHRASRRGRHPRFSSLDSMIGNVELSLDSLQTIRTIELVLKGSMITGMSLDTGLITFLEHSYTLWDRKFGDPWQLARGQLNSSSSKKYDGKMSGNWVFPFSIPFPTHVDLSTLRAVYPGDSEGPLRFLPELLPRDSPLTPFRVDGSPHGTHDFSVASGELDHITPFDTRSPFCLSEKGRSTSHHDHTFPNPSTQFPHFSPISPTLPLITGTPSPEPFQLSHSEPSGSAPSSSGHPAAAKRGSPYAPPSATFDSVHARHRGATSMQDSETLPSSRGYVLPQSFLERDVMANIQYELVLSICHGRFSTESRAKTPVIYTPTTTPPESMTLGRQISYREREILPPPALDPEGWKQLPRVTIRGTYVDQRTLNVQYTLYLAMPLSYARGTVIPCCLTIACDDPSALNILSSPRSPRVRLKRSTRFLQNRESNRPLTESVSPSYVGATSPVNNILINNPKLSKTPLELTQRERPNRSSARYSTSNIEPFMLEANSVGGENVLGSSDDDNEQEIGNGVVWCIPPSFTQEPRMRNLYGEIHLPRGLQPTCKFPLFNVLYQIELVAPLSTAFVPDIQRKPSLKKGKAPAGPSGKGKDECKDEHVYLSHFVEITTGVRQDEPIPLPFVRATDRVGGPGEGRP